METCSPLNDRVTIMRTPPFRIVCLLWVMSLAGCATFGSKAPRPKTAGPASAKSATDAPADSASEGPDALFHPLGQIDHLLRQSFTSLQEGRRLDARASLDSAATLLTEVVSDAEEAEISSYRLGGVLRVALELYHDLIPQTLPVEPDSPLAHLLLALPSSLSSQLDQHPFFEEFIIRRLAGTSDVPIDYVPEVVESIHYFRTIGRKVFARWLSRSSAYLPMIRQIFWEEGLPLDLAYKAMVESGFNPRAYSRARAAGVWQFVPRTAVLYGLRRNTWVDERRDPEKSTRAAARHLQNLRGLFGDWRLVVAAYNCGQGRLQRILEKSGTRDFWKLKGLPKETEMHVPRFMAAVIISQDPEWFGFVDIDYETPVTYDVVPVSECVDLKVASECARTTHKKMSRLNPELRWGYTPPLGRRGTYSLRVPKGATETFMQNYAKVPSSQKVQMVDYLVRHGDTASEIATRLRVSTSALLEANRIRNPRRLRAGSRLKIPIRPERYSRAQEIANTGSEVGDPPSQASHFNVTYEIQEGDTLWEIARDRGVTMEQLQAWNGLVRTHTIHPGKKLTIWRPRYAFAMANRHSKDEGEHLYTVRRGDTLWEIARAFGTSVKDLKKWNEIRDPSRLRAGASIRVYGQREPKID